MEKSISGRIINDSGTSCRWKEGASFLTCFHGPVCTWTRRRPVCVEQCAVLCMRQSRLREIIGVRTFGGRVCLCVHEWECTTGEQRRRFFRRPVRFNFASASMYRAFQARRILTQSAAQRKFRDETRPSRIICIYLPILTRKYFFFISFNESK